MLLGLLGAAATTAADYAWARRRVLGYFVPVDAARLVVALLESGGPEARACAHQIRFGDVPLPPMEARDLLDEAAGHACWRALTVVLEDLRAKSPTVHNDKTAEVEGLFDDMAVRPATMAHLGTHYRFGRSVIQGAATRGHLNAVQWLWPRSAKTSGQGEPTRRETSRSSECSKQERFERSTRTEVVMKAAADARHFHIIHWMIQTSPIIHCVLSYDDELQAVCWIMRDDQHPRWCILFCATQKYGFSQAHSRDPTSAEGSNRAGATEMPLADAFARDGDLATLEKIHARSNYLQLIGSNAITQAAERGHLEVVKWLHEVLPMYVVSSCFLAAAKGGHLPILEWMHAELDFAILPRAIIDAAAHGHVHVVRWYWSIDPSPKPHFEGMALADAIRNGHLNVVIYLHEECQTPLEGRYLSDALAKCPSIETLEYVLDRVEPLPLTQPFLQRVVHESSVEVVKHLILNRGLWSFDALRTALGRTEPYSALELSQFLYAHAQKRAMHLQTPVNDQVDLTRITIGSVWHNSVTEWLLKAVPEVAVWDHQYSSMNDAYVVELSWRPIFIACLKYRPEECRELSWFPEWTVRVNSFEAFELLARCDHPQLRDLETFQSVIKYTRDARFMLKLLPLRVDEPKLRQEVVEWAATFGMVTVLDRVFEQEDRLVQRHVLKRVAYHVGASGHIDMAEWLLSKCLTRTILSSTMLKSVSLDAVCRGHTRVLQWLQDHQLLPTRPHAIESMVAAAGTARQVRSLQWLFSKEAMVVSPQWVARALVDGVRQNHAEIVAFITRMFERDELPVSDQNCRRIRGYLLKQQRAIENDDAAAAVVAIVQEDETTRRRKSKCLRHK